MSLRIFRSPFLIAGFALLLRVAIVGYYSWTSPYHLSTVWDAGYEMVRVAANLAAGAGFSSPFLQPSGPTAILPPAYPFLLSLIFRLFGTQTLAAAVVAVGLNFVLSAATCVLIFRFAKATVGESAGVIAAWIWALYLPVILSAGFHIWDSALTTFLAAAAYLLASRLAQGGWRRWLGYGLLWGAGALVNPSLLAIYGVLFAWACWQRRRRPWLRDAAIAAVMLAAVIGPWTVRNYRTFHRLMPVRSNFGEELWIGNHEGADGYFRVIIYPLGSTAEFEQYRRRGEAGYMDWKQQQAVAFIKAHPAEFWRLVRLRMSCFWGGVYDSGYAPIFLPTTLLGLGGLAVMARRKRECLWLFALPLIFYPTPYYFTHADLRFRFPIEPLLACLSGYVVVTLVGELRERRRLREQKSAPLREAANAG